MIGDTAIVVVVLLLAPGLVERATRRAVSLRSWHWVLVWGAWCWFCYALFSAELAEWLLGVTRTDAIAHESAGRMIASDVLKVLGGALPWRALTERFHLGNGAYQFYLGWLYALSGCTERGCCVLNAFLAWWGMLNLLTMLAPKDPGKKAPWWLVATTVSFPSAVFWTSANLKEGMVLWGICQIVCLLDPDRPGSIAWAGLGFAVVALFRPHIAGAWAAAVTVGLALPPGRRRLGFLAAGGLLGATLALQAWIGIELTYGQVMAYLEKYRSYIVSVGHSAVVPVLGKRPVPVLSGLLTLFVRPFIWEGRGLRSVLASLEIWTVSAAVFTGWWAIPPWRKRLMLSRREVLAAVCACLVFAFLYTYMGNLGLLARQRLQIIPALVILLAVPRLERRTVLKESQDTLCYGGPRGFGFNEC